MGFMLLLGIASFSAMFVMLDDADDAIDSAEELEQENGGTGDTIGDDGDHNASGNDDTDDGDDPGEDTDRITYAAWTDANDSSYYYRADVDEGAIVHEGSGQDDTLTGNSGQDFIFGDEGADQLSGGAGDDVIDHFFGLAERGHNHPQADWYEDGAADTLSGGSGDDTISAGAGDQITGGSGADSISVFFDMPEPQTGENQTGDDSAAPEAAKITDFASGSDQLQITVEVPDQPPELYEGKAEIRTAADGTTEVWASVTVYAPQTDAEGNLLQDQNGALLRDEASASAAVAPFLAARLGAGSAIALSDISVSPFWNEMS